MHHALLRPFVGAVVALACFFLAPLEAFASGGGAHGPNFAGVPIEFYLFAATLLGVAMFHQRTMQIAISGLVVITAFKLVFTDLHLGEHLMHEWKLATNLFGLLLGFAVLAKHFEESRLPEVMPKWLPQGFPGAFVLLLLVFVLSSFLDNIAAAMIGATLARTVFQHRVHVGYLAAIVAASNAGGAGSVIGDTTTTMMWIDGVAAKELLPAFVGGGAAVLVCGLIASRQQHAHHPIQTKIDASVQIDGMRLLIVGMILAGAIAANIFLDFPAVGVWIAILIGAMFRKTHWHILEHPVKGSVFLLSLVISASMMPVESLPPATWVTTLSLGFISAIFDNIPLTKLALDQGGYAWDFLAYAVGFGGSMIWFGSSAGVAVATMFPQAKSVAHWLRHGWHVAVGYVIGFFVLLWVVGWDPHPPHREEHMQPATLQEDAEHSAPELRSTIPP